MSNAKEPGSGERWARWWRPARWTSATLVVAGGAASVLASGWAVCEQRLATVGAQAVVEVCRPPAMSDLPVVGGVVVVLLLLLPDLAEVGLPGFISLKRRVEDTEGRLAGLELQLTQTSQMQQAAAQDVDSRASAINAVNVNLYDFETALEGLRTKTGRDLPAAAATPGIRDVSPRRAQLEAHLLRVWAELEPLVASSQLAVLEEQLHAARHELEVARHSYRAAQDERARALSRVKDPRPDVAEEAQQQLARSDERTLNAAAQMHLAEAHYEAAKRRAQTAERAGVQLTSSEARALRKWTAPFQEEVALVEAAQQAVAQARPIEDDKLDAAIKLAEGLVVAWNLRRARPAADGSQTTQRQA